MKQLAVLSTLVVATFVGAQVPPTGSDKRLGPPIASPNRILLNAAARAPAPALALDGGNKQLEVVDSTGKQLGRFSSGSSYSTRAVLLSYAHELITVPLGSVFLSPPSGSSWHAGDHPYGAGLQWGVGAYLAYPSSDCSGTPYVGYLGHTEVANVGTTYFGFPSFDGAHWFLQLVRPENTVMQSIYSIYSGSSCFAWFDHSMTPVWPIEVVLPLAPIATLPLFVR